MLGLFLLHSVETRTGRPLSRRRRAAEPSDALFFSTLSFSTLGAEEISAARDWQLFGSIEGVNGFLLIGWSTAYLIPAWTRYGPFHEDRDF